VPDCTGRARNDFGFFRRYLAVYFFTDPAEYQSILYGVADTRSLSVAMERERLKPCGVSSPTTNFSSDYTVWFNTEFCKRDCSGSNKATGALNHIGFANKTRITLSPRAYRAVPFWGTNKIDISTPSNSSNFIFMPMPPA
jgi:hypothetical protein